MDSFAGKDLQTYAKRRPSGTEPAVRGKNKNGPAAGGHLDEVFART